MSTSPRRLATRLVDLACILAALSSAGLWAGAGGAMSWLEIAAPLASFVAVWLVVGKRLGAHAIPPSRNLGQSIRRTLESWTATWGVAGLIVVSTVAPLGFDIWLALIVGAILLVVARLVRSFGPLGETSDRVRTIVIGSCPSARALSSSGDSSETLDVVGFVPFPGEDPSDMPHLRMLGTTDDLAEVLRRNELDAALVSPSDAAVTGQVHRAIETCEKLGLQTNYFPAFLDTETLHVGLTWSDNRPGLDVRTIARGTLAAAGKRAIDVLGSAAGILALLPVFVACALAVKLTSRGPIFYKQQRVGQGGRTFQCFKFRSMRVNAHAQLTALRHANQQDGPAFKMSQDPRVTPVGRILRKFSVDELPQLFNVLLGDMSLVGPRPPIPSEVEQYAWWQRRRISVKPGLTCIWQVYGRNRVSFKRWVEMDLYYIDNWSLWMDLKLIAHTVRVVLRGTGM